MILELKAWQSLAQTKYGIHTFLSVLRIRLFLVCRFRIRRFSVPVPVLDPPSFVKKKKKKITSNWLNTYSPKDQEFIQVLLPGTSIIFKK
jgi:hypothetical protein